MQSPLRAIVWLAVIALAMGAGWYISQAPDTAQASAAPSSPGSYLFVAGGDDPYWQLCTEGAQQRANELGATLEVLTPRGEGEDGLREQLAWLTSVDSEKFDGVAIGPIDAERTTTPINRIAEATTVVTVDSDAPASRRLCYIGSSNYEAGGMAADAVRRALPDGGKVVVLLASLSKTNAAQRKEGFDDQLLGDRTGEEEDADQDAAEDDAPRYEVVDYLMDFGDHEKCAENLRQAISETPDLGAIVGTFGYHGPIALDVVSEADASIPIVAFDEHEQTLAGVERGAVLATIVQNPYMFGYEAIGYLEQLRSGEFLSLPSGSQVNIGVHCKRVDKQNLDEFKAGARDNTGEKAS